MRHSARRCASAAPRAAVVGAVAGERGDAGAIETAATLVHLAGRYAGRVLDDEGKLLDHGVEPCGARSLAAAAAAEDDAAQDARAVAEVLEALIYEWLAQVRQLPRCPPLVAANFADARVGFGKGVWLVRRANCEHSSLAVAIRWSHG